MFFKLKHSFARLVIAVLSLSDTPAPLPLFAAPKARDTESQMRNVDSRQEIKGRLT